MKLRKWMHLTDSADTSSVSIILQTLQRTVVSTHRLILYSNGTESDEVLPLIRFSDQKAALCYMYLQLLSNIS